MEATRQEDSRANQKARTREAIVQAARELQRDGVNTPTVVQAAKEARVSRATAYRYFPTQEALLVELSLTPAVAPVEKLLANLTDESVERRLHLLLESFGPVVLAEEANLRRALWVYLDTWLRHDRNSNAEAPAIREGRRMRWIDQVLEPLDDLPDDKRRRLRSALALTVGIDSIVIMKDACGLDGDEALAVLDWTATAILRAGLDSVPKGR